MNQLPQPSRQPYEQCIWKKISGAGIVLWGQSCDFGDKSVRLNFDPKVPGIVLQDGTSTATVIQVFELPNKKIEDLLSTLNIDTKCVFNQIESDRTDVTKFTLVPTNTELRTDEPTVSTCNGYGMGNSGVHYFEIHSSNPSKALFIDAGQESPLFDEQTIRVK